MRSKSIIPAFVITALALISGGCEKYFSGAPKAGAREKIPVTEQTAAAASTNELPHDIDSSTVVAYFSADGKSDVTGKTAIYIADTVNAPVLRIEPLKQYPGLPDARREQAEKEHAENVRPAINTLSFDISECETLFIGFPIWCDDAPMAVYTFLENEDMIGKRIIPFCVYTGSDDKEKAEKAVAEISGEPVLWIRGEEAVIMGSGLRAKTDEWLSELGFIQE